MTSTATDLQARLDALDEAIGSGELIVRAADGRSTTYRTIEDLQKARTFVAGQLFKLNNPTERRGMASSIIVNRGLT